MIIVLNTTPTLPRDLLRRIGLTICRFLVLLGVTGCGNMLPVARSKGAVFSDEGVVFAVVGQNCKQSPDASQPSKTQIDATFAIEVGNAARDPLTLHPARFLLKVSDRTVRVPAPDEAVESISVAPATTSRFELRFMASGTCTQEMQLVPDAAIELRGRAINIDAFRFVPVEPR